MKTTFSCLTRSVLLGILTIAVMGCAASGGNQAESNSVAPRPINVESTANDIVLPPGSHPKAICPDFDPVEYNPSTAEIERDNIYQLVAYGVVLKDWQTKTWAEGGAEETARGYNIGAVLVDDRKSLGEGIVCWARNTVITTRNGTQHGEVRLMTNYLANAQVANLKGTGARSFKIYTTLEPCAMCGGMMTLQSLNTTIYGQTDPDFGDGIQRLEVNTHAVGGFCSFPRGVYSNITHLKIADDIDQAYHEWQETSKEGLTSWLVSNQARELYEEAVRQLREWQVGHTANKPVLAQAINYLDTIVPDEFTPIPYSVGCSGQ